MSRLFRVSLPAALLSALLLCGCGGKRTEEKTVVILETAPTAAAATPAALPEIAGSPPETAAASALARDWYGWWKMDHCRGDWSSMYGYYWDCCAQMEEADGTIRLLLWDEDMPRDNCLAAAELAERDGTLRCTGGSFLDRALAADSWRVTRGEDDCGVHWKIEGEYEAVGKGGFHYEIYLRPWGSRWPGSAEEKPYYYERWYLPLLEAGETMPDEIGNIKEESQS